MINEELEILFTSIYDNHGWPSSETKSGGCATVANSYGFRTNLKQIVDKYKIKSVLDLGCGDWNWMKECQGWLEDYTGVDVVKELIEKNKELFGSRKVKFIHADMLEHLKSQRDNSVDLALVRQTFEHLPESYNLEVIKELKRVAKYFIITGQDESHKTGNVDMPDGKAAQESRGIQLHESPYVKLLKSPLSTFVDGDKEASHKVGPQYLGHLFTVVSESPKPSKKNRKKNLDRFLD